LKVDLIVSSRVNSSGRLDEPLSVVGDSGCEGVMKDFPPAGEIHDLWQLLGRTRDSMHKARQRELDQYGITTRQAAVLHFVHDLGGVAKPTEISRWLLRERHSIHELLKRMEKAGLVRNVGDPKRKNGLRVMLTDRGRKAYYQSSKREVISKIMSSLHREQRDKLRSCLQVLLDRSLKEIGMDGKLPLSPASPPAEPAHPHKAYRSGR
jgi:DNA-binding MarR family transcriptional regulator